MKEFHFGLDSHWRGGPRDPGGFMGSSLQVPVSIPTELGGPGQGTSPEELLMAASASCYLINLSSMLTRANVQFERIDLRTNCRLERRPALRLTNIEHRPRIIQREPPTAATADVIASAVQAAEQMCMISHALRGNVHIAVAGPEYQPVTSESERVT